MCDFHLSFDRLDRCQKKSKAKKKINGKINPQKKNGHSINPQLNQ